MSHDDDIYDIGDEAKILLHIENDVGAPSDPLTLELRVQPPDDDWITPVWSLALGTVVRTSVGEFYALVPATKGGVWHGKFATTGDPTQAGTVTWRVRHDRVRAPA